MAVQNVPLISKIVSCSVRAATHSGQLIRHINAKGDLGIVNKSSKLDIQTSADRISQACIVKSLSCHFPKATIICEEEDQVINHLPSSELISGCVDEIFTKSIPQDLLSLKEEDIVIWVDPLDGTLEFSRGFLDHATVMIGVAAGGKPIGGVIHQPYYNYRNPSLPQGRTVWAIPKVGYGGIVPTYAPRNRRFVSTSRSHSNDVVQKSIQNINPDEVIRVGGAGYKVLLLLDGAAHAYVFASKGCKKWDTCAAEAVLEATGGKLSDIKGNPYTYYCNVPYSNSGGVLATLDKTLHPWYCSALGDEIWQALMKS